MNPALTVLLLAAVSVAAVAVDRPAYDRHGPHRLAALDFPDLQDTRRDQRAVPMLLHLPMAGGPYPLVIMSHGGGGNRESELYQAEHLASHGYVVLSIEHMYSNTKQTKFTMSRAGGNLKLMEAVHRTTKDAREVLGRPRDVSFAIDQAEEWNRTHPKLAGRIDTGKIGVMGHSYGAYTTLAEPGRAKRWREAPDSWVGTQRRAIVAFSSRRAVGAKNAPRDRRHLAQGRAKCLLRAAALRAVCGAQSILDYLEPVVPPGRGLAGDLGDRRVTFGFAMSPQSPGTTYFGPDSYRTVRCPLVMLTGSKDDQKRYDAAIMPASARREVFTLLPPGQKYFLWLKNVDHFAFADNAKSFLFPSRARRDTTRITRALMVVAADHFLKARPEAATVLNEQYARSLLGRVVSDLEWLEK